MVKQLVTNQLWMILTLCCRRILSSSSQVASRPADLFTPYRLPMADPEAGVAGHSILAAYRASRQDAPTIPPQIAGFWEPVHRLSRAEPVRTFP